MTKTEIAMAQYSNDQLCQIVDDLNQEFIPTDCLARKVAEDFFGLPQQSITLIQLIGLGLPVAVELVKRLREFQKNLQ